ncbi:MAG: 16S rRNA (adenine(1518)-N(6)/adenine(1519)-N(6))-dimethyltransferase RsmA [bacterium JZ-2024 1]
MQRKEIVRLLRRYGIQPSKRKGQNFLLSESVLRRMVEALLLKPEDAVLEIGAGFGFLSQKIAPYVSHVYAFEIDRRFLPCWEEILSSFPHITLISEDFLAYPLSNLPEKSIKWVGNIPYSLTTPILQKLVSERKSTPLAVLMVQKEVGQRLTAREGSKAFGRLTIFLQCFFSIKKVLSVPRTSFFPVPEVDSVVLQFFRREQPLIEIPEHSLFFQLVREGFGERRKTLKHNLARWLGSEKASFLLEKSHINPRLRPEEIPLSQWNKLALALYEMKEGL